MALVRRHSVGGQGPSIPEWIAQYLNGEYPTPPINDFPACLKNGVVLSSLLHKHNKDLIDIDAARANPGLECLRKAFAAAETVGIPKLLDPEDIYNQTDKLSIITQMSLWKTKLSGGTFGFGKKAAASPKEKDEKIKPAAHNKSLLSAGAHGRLASSTGDLPSKPAEPEPTVTLVVPPPLMSGASSPSVLNIETISSPRREGKPVTSIPSMTLSAPNSPQMPHVGPEAKTPTAEHKPQAAESKPAAEVKKPAPESKPAAEPAKPAAKPKGTSLMLHSPTLSRLSTDSSPSTPGSGGVAAARLKFNPADPKQKLAGKPATDTKAAAKPAAEPAKPAEIKIDAPASPADRKRAAEAKSAAEHKLAAHTEHRALPTPHATPAPVATPTSPKAAPTSPKPADAVVVPVVASLVTESAPVVTPAPSVAQNVSLSLSVTEEVQEVTLKK